MVFIVRQKVGNHVYPYESVSCRDKDGNLRGHRVPIGKLDAAGFPVYKNDYIERMAQADTPLPIPKHTSYTRSDIAEYHIKEFGSFYLFHQIACDIGLLDIPRNGISGQVAETIRLGLFYHLQRGAVHVPSGLAFKDIRVSRKPFRRGYYPPAWLFGPSRAGELFQRVGEIPRRERISGSRYNFCFILFGIDRRCGVGIQPGRGETSPG